MAYHETVYLDTIDGFEFENLCTKIFERLRWGKIEHIGFVKDGGRDIIIHQPQGGSIIVECKHQPNTSIGRPIVQKLHSAVISSGAIKGIVITTGKFSNDAIEHAKIISDKTPIELIDIHGITDLAEKAQIKILFSTGHSAILSFPASDIPTLGQKLNSVFEHFQSYPKLASEIIQIIPNNLKLEAKYLIKYDIDHDFTTSAGLIRSLHEHNLALIVDAENGSLMDSHSVLFLDNTNLIEPTHIPALACPTTRTNFTLGTTTLTKMVKNHLVKAYTETVSYRGRNNVSYKKVCQPGERSITIKDTKQVLLPRYDLLMNALDNQYRCSLIQNNTQVKLTSTNLYNCRICNKTISKKILLCNACGNITHGPKFFSSHGFTCKNCKKTICKNCAYYTRRFLFFKKILCESCANKLPKSKKLVK
ncbi:MAG: restriction endonuclease [Thermodesulfobacteriota bacterium]